MRILVITFIILYILWYIGKRKELFEDAKKRKDIFVSSLICNFYKEKRYRYWHDGNGWDI